MLLSYLYWAVPSMMGCFIATLSYAVTRRVPPLPHAIVHRWIVPTQLLWVQVPSTTKRVLCRLLHVNAQVPLACGNKILEYLFFHSEVLNMPQLRCRTYWAETTCLGQELFLGMATLKTSRACVGSRFPGQAPVCIQSNGKGATSMRQSYSTSFQYCWLIR